MGWPRWVMRLRYEHAAITLLALRTEICFCERWVVKAKAHVEERQAEVEQLRRDLQAVNALCSIANRSR